MKKFLLPLLACGLLISCGPTTSEPTTNSSEPTTSNPTTSDTSPTTTVLPNHDITIEVPTDLGVELTDIKDAKKAKDGDYFFIYGIVSQFTYGFDTNSGKDTKVGFYIVDNTSSMYVYCGYGALDNVNIGNAVLVNGEITHFISQAEAGAGAEIGYYGAYQLAADTVEVINSGYTEIPDVGIERKTIKELSTTDFRENDLSGTIFRVNATLTKSEVSNTAVYYFNDPSMDYSIYTYSTISGREFSWLDEYVDTTYEWTIAVHSLRSRDEAWRCIPIEPFLPVTITDQDRVRYSLDRLARQFSPTYNSTTSIKLLEFDEKLPEAKITYTSKSQDHTITKTDEGTFLNIDGTKLGKFTVEISTDYVCPLFVRVVEIEVIEKIDFDGVTIKEAQQSQEGAVVKIKGIYVRTAANVTGIYLADETGIIPVYHVASFVPEDYMVGEELIFEGTIMHDFTNDGSHEGYKKLANAELISHDSVVHEWNTSLCEGDATISELLDGDGARVSKIYKVRGYVDTLATDFYSNKQLKSEDGSSYLTLYCSSAAQLSWLDEYEDQVLDYYVFIRDLKNNKLRFEILSVA